MTTPRVVDATEFRRAFDAEHPRWTAPAAFLLVAAYVAAIAYWGADGTAALVLRWIACGLVAAGLVALVAFPLMRPILARRRYADYLDRGVLGRRYDTSITHDDGDGGQIPVHLVVAVDAAARADELRSILERRASEVDGRTAQTRLLDLTAVFGDSGAGGYLVVGHHTCPWCILLPGKHTLDVLELDEPG